MAFNKTNSFTAGQLELIDFCIRAGYGWSIFAKSVQSGGFCTERQQSTLTSMQRRIQKQRDLFRERSCRVRKYKHRKSSGHYDFNLDVDECAEWGMLEHH